MFSRIDVISSLSISGIAFFIFVFQQLLDVRFADILTPVYVSVIFMGILFFALWYIFYWTLFAFIFYYEISIEIRVAISWISSILIPGILISLVDQFEFLNKVVFLQDVNETMSFVLYVFSVSASAFAWYFIRIYSGIGFGNILATLSIVADIVARALPSDADTQSILMAQRQHKHLDQYLDGLAHIIDRLPKRKKVKLAEDTTVREQIIEVTRLTQDIYGTDIGPDIIPLLKSIITKLEKYVGEPEC